MSNVLEQQIKDFLASEVAPFLRSDGGDCEFVAFNEEHKTVTLKYVGACAHCPSSYMHTHQAIESMLVKRFPGVVETLERYGNE
jgi:NFU1 iron-sulfur cluster scaffold homolog, mitochondrial